MSDAVIKVENLSKVYKLYKDPIDRLKEALNPFGKKYHHDFYALKDVSFEVKKGETIGIIGKNGSGKSTLLKILTGVLTQTSGTCHVKGKISSLLELGAGFNPELSGIENVYFNGSILGYSREEMDSKLSAILEFADIGEFVYQPVKTYSSGMQVRLAFAVAISVDPDVLIVDEALAVGDIRFQQKCYRKLKEFKEKGKTIILVSHDVGAVINYCDRAVWLLDGGVYKIGEPESVTKDYVSYMYYGLEGDKKNAKDGKPEESIKEGIVDSKILELESVEACQSFGEGGAKIKRVGLFSAETGKKIKVFTGGENVSFYAEIEVMKENHSPIFGFFVKDSYGNGLFGLSSALVNKTFRSLRSNDSVIVEFKFNFPLLKNGDYSFTVAISEGTQDNHVQLCWVHDAYVVKISNHENGHARLGNYFLLEGGTINLI